MVLFLVGFAAGAVATAYALGILLSSSRESDTFTASGGRAWTYRVTVNPDGSVTDESGNYWT
jgi:hypothetical protein